MEPSKRGEYSLGNGLGGGTGLILKNGKGQGEIICGAKGAGGGQRACLEVGESWLVSFHLQFPMFLSVSCYVISS